MAPIVASLLSQIREATFARHRADEAADYFTRPPVLWALDEVAGIAPMRDLPETLSQSGGQGLLVAVCLQDLQMARARWDKAADAFLTLFGNIVVHPGIRDERHAARPSRLSSESTWVTVTSEGMTQNTGRDRQGRNTNEGDDLQLAPNSKSTVSTPAPWPKAGSRNILTSCWALRPMAGAGSSACPTTSAPPWVQLLVGTMEYAAWSGDVLERCWELPAPILDRDHDGRFLAAADVTGAQLVERYRQAVADLKQMTHSRRELLGRLGNDSLLAGYDDSWSSRLPSPQLSYIAIGQHMSRRRGLPAWAASAPSLAEIARALEGLSEVRRARPDEEVVITSNTADMDGRWTPRADLPAIPILKPDWMVEIRRASDGTCGIAAASQRHGRGCPDDADRPVGKPDHRHAPC